jgi:hypothetical protein
MPLSAPAPRQHIHTRQVECRGYRRDDGLWDIEGHLTDVKTYGFESEFRGEVAPGMPIHDMWLRLTVDDALQIHAVEAVTAASPYEVCPAVTPNFQRLVGLKIRPGFNSRVKELLGGVEGCTHLVELLGPLATTAFQTIFPWKHRYAPQSVERPKGKRPRLLDTCHAFKSDGEIAQRLWPDFVKPG